MKLLVLGKEGQLARSLADAAYDHPSLDLSFAGRRDADLAIVGSVAALIADRRPDLVINAAAYTLVDEAETDRNSAFRINSDAAGEAASAAHSVGAGFIHISTDYVFDGAASAQYREEHPTNPINVYGASKLAGEEAVRDANPDHLIVRTSWLVSRYGHNFVRTMLRLAEDRNEVSVVADQVGRPTVVADLAAALLSLAQRWDTISKGTIHIAGGGDPASWADLAEAVFEARRAIAGAAPTVRKIATDGYPTPAARPHYSVLDCSKAEKEGLGLSDWRGSVRALTQALAEQAA